MGTLFAKSGFLHPGTTILEPKIHSKLAIGRPLSPWNSVFGSDAAPAGNRAELAVWMLVQWLNPKGHCPGSAVLSAGRLWVFGLAKGAGKHEDQTV